VARDGRFLVLQQRTKVDPNFQLVHEQTLHFGDRLDLTPWAGTPLFMSVSIRPSLLGRAVTFLYQQEPLFMRVARGGWPERYRIVPTMAAQPFLVNPLLDATYDVLGFYASVRGRRTNSVVFERPRRGSCEFQDALTVRLYTSPGFPNAVKGISTYDIFADVQGRVFESQPKFVHSPCGIQVVIFHGSPAWLMCAPSKIVLDIPPKTSVFSGYFGVPGVLYPGDVSKREPANIAIEVCSKPGACRQAFSQLLAPSSGANDGDRFSFRIAIDSSHDRYIELTTASGPPVPAFSSLSVWSHCRFEESPPR
jgi:hypothetical protein